MECGDVRCATAVTARKSKSPRWRPFRAWCHARLSQERRSDAIADVADAVRLHATRETEPTQRGAWLRCAAGVAAGDPIAFRIAARIGAEDWHEGGPEPIGLALTALTLAASADTSRRARRARRACVAAAVDLAVLAANSARIAGLGTPRGRRLRVATWRALARIDRLTAPFSMHQRNPAHPAEELVCAWLETEVEILRGDLSGWPPNSRLRDLGRPLAAALELATRRPRAADEPDLERLRTGDTELAADGTDAAPGHAIVLHPNFTEARLSERRDRLWRLYESLAKPMPYAPVPTPSAVRPALEALRVEMPNMAAVIDAVLAELAMGWATGANGPLRLRPMLLVGPPGIGKTRLARRLADALGLRFGWLGLGGTSEPRELAGTARGWASTHAAWPVDRIVALGSANPLLLLLDEVDKVGESRRSAHAHDTLLGMLERDSARAFTDECVGGPVDLSHVSWILTANDAAGLPGPLLSRLQVVRQPSPRAEDLPAILDGVLRDIAAERGLRDPRLLPGLDRMARRFIRASFARRPDMRALRRLIESLLARAALDELSPGDARRN
ncbi:AAA family ATPase [Falsiroseomonas sp.]|uniref:AAA family ATPase n=1 Tax=Falsiroseomonas sp. TaxID=2870721 RepID=UPI0035649F83